MPIVTNPINDTPMYEGNVYELSSGISLSIGYIA
jgi:hypothetical protein